MAPTAASAARVAQSSRFGLAESCEDPVCGEDAAVISAKVVVGIGTELVLGLDVDRRAALRARAESPDAEGAAELRERVAVPARRSVRAPVRRPAAVLAVVVEVVVVVAEGVAVRSSGPAVGLLLEVGAAAGRLAPRVVVLLVEEAGLQLVAELRAFLPLGEDAGAPVVADMDAAADVPLSAARDLDPDVDAAAVGAVSV